MYRAFFGLRDRPFDLAPDPGYLLMTPVHREALAMLQYGLMSQKGLIVLTGDAGTGKTTLLRAVQADAQNALLFVTITNPRLRREEFVETVAHGFGLSDAAALSKPRLLRELDTLLRDRLTQGLWSALIVDEAHALSNELLEEVRLLANLETDETKLLSIVLAGQPELADRLNEASQWHLKQRVALRCALNCLTKEESFALIASRIRRAGGQPSAVFTREAVECCHEYARGIPRLINVICDNALIAAFAAAEKPVTAARVKEIARDLDLATEPSAGAPEKLSATESLPVESVVVEADMPPPLSDGQPEPEREGQAAGLFRAFSEPRRAWFIR